jgi:glycosyltransferase involved in cell wall biosynthesis
MEDSNMLLTIGMMVKNEEKYLEECLESLNPILEELESELVIVDTGSDDRTIEIAQKYTDKVYFHEWNNHFSEMRNKVISYSKGDWFLTIDGDEVLVNSKQIIDFFNSKLYKKYKTAVVNVKNYTNIEKNRFSSFLSPRLFKNDSNFKYEGAVHNQPKYKKPIYMIDADIYHYGYISSDKELMEKKFKRTSKLLKEELKKDPKNVYYWYQLSKSYAMHNDDEEGLDAIEKAYKMAKENNLNLKRRMYIYNQLANMHMKLNNVKKVEKTCLESLKIKKGYLDIYYFLGWAKSQLGETKKSIENYENYLKLYNNYDESASKNDTTFTDVTISSIDVVYTNLIISYSKENNYENIIEYGKKIEDIDYFKKIAHLIIKSYIKLEMYDDLLDFFKKTTENKRDILKIEIEDAFVSNNYENYIIKQLIDHFSKLDSEYGLLNKVRSTTDDIQKYRAEKIKNEIKLLNFNQLSNYYGDIIYYLFKLKDSSAYEILKSIREKTLDEFVKYLNNKYDDLAEVIMNFIDSQKEDISEVRVNKSLFRYLLALDNDVKKNNKSIIDNYLDAGFRYMEKLYKNKVFEDDLIYELKNDEEAFLLYMQKAFKVKEVDLKAYIQYLHKGIKIYPLMKKVVETLMLEVKKNQEQVNKDLERQKKEFKMKIETLISQNQLEESSSLINEYEKSFERDAEIYSMLGVIALNKGNINKAELMFERGLLIDKNNTDLLFNMAYTYKILNNYEMAKKYYIKAGLRSEDLDDFNKVKAPIELTKTKNNFKNFKILHGTMGIANQMNTLTESLRKKGIHANFLNYYPNYLDYCSDDKFNLIYDINNSKNDPIKIAEKLMLEYDLFHFHFGTSLMPNHSDLPLLKKLGKTTIMHHWGSDVRIYSKAYKNNPYVKVKKTNEKKITKKLKFFSEYISHCIVSDFELYYYVKEFYENVHFIKQAIDLKKYKVNYKKINNDKITIVHAPTSPEIKGTKYIVDAIELLKKEYNIEFKLVKGLSHSEAKKIYREADLIIDQLLLGSYGLFSIEAMAMGKPVVTWISDFMKEKYPDDLPIISANPDSIKNKLKYILENRDMLLEIGKNGRKYIEKHHDKEKVVKNLINLYEDIS